MITLRELMVCDSLIITKSVDNGMKFGEEMPDSRLTEKSDDKLEIKGGKIEISEKREGKKIDGTKLIEELINSKEVIHIVLSEESYNHYNPNDSLYGKAVIWNNKNYYNYYPIYTKWTSNPSKEEHNTVFGPGISENSIRKELGFNIRGVY